MSNILNNNCILYYSSIQFSDKIWVKSALLIWDKIYLIVPKDYKSIDSYAIKSAIDEGVIENIVVKEADLDMTSKRDMSFCKKLRYFPSGFTCQTFNGSIHQNKMDDRIKKYFASLYDDFSDGFFKLPKDIINANMFFLVKTMSSRRNLQKNTDNSDMYTSMVFFNGKGDFADDAEEIDNKKEIQKNQ